MVGLTSAAGLVGFLSEPDPALQAFALERLNDEIESVWTEVSGAIGQMYVYTMPLMLPDDGLAAKLRACATCASGWPRAEA